MGVTRQVEKHAAVPPNEFRAAAEFPRNPLRGSVDDDIEAAVFEVLLDPSGIRQVQFGPRGRRNVVSPAKVFG